MRRCRSLRLVFMLITFLAGTSAVAQAPVLIRGEPVSARVRAVAQTAPEAADYDRLVAESIGLVLIRSGFELDEAGVDRPTADVGPDPELVWEYSILSLIPRLHVSVSVRDAHTGTLISTVSGRARTNVTLFNSVDDVVTDSIGDALEYLALRGSSEGEILPTPITEVLPPHRPTVVGEELVLQPIAPLSGDSEEGVLLAEGVTVPVLIRRPGHYPAHGVTGADAGLPEPQPYQRFGVQLHTSLGRLGGAGMGARYAIVPDRVSVGMELDMYVSGMGQDAPYSVLHGEGRLLAEVTLLAGRRVSLRASSGVGGVVTTFLSGLAAPYTDLYWNVINVMPVLHTGRQHWFVRVGSSYYQESERGFFPGGLGDGSLQLFVGTYRRF